MNMIQRTEAALAGKVQSAQDLNWAKSGVWVSRYETIQAEEKSGLFRNTAEQMLNITSGELKSRYVQIGPTEWQTRFKPVLAIPVRQPRLMDIGDGQIVMLETGQAILNDDGSFSIASKDDYARLYKVVGHRGRPKPLEPFAY